RFGAPPPSRGLFSVLRVARVDPGEPQRPEALIAGLASAGGGALTYLIRPLAHGAFASARAAGEEGLERAERALEAALRVGLGFVEVEPAPADPFHLAVPLAGALPDGSGAGRRCLRVPCRRGVRCLAALELRPPVDRGSGLGRGGDGNGSAEGEGRVPDVGALVRALAGAGVEAALTLSVSPPRVPLRGVRAPDGPRGHLALFLLTPPSATLGEARREADALASLAEAAAESALGWRARRVAWPRLRRLARALLERRVPSADLGPGDLSAVAGVPALRGLGGLTSWSPAPALDPPPAVGGVELGVALGPGWSLPLRLAPEWLPLHVAVFGAPGCGKTTLVRGFLRRYSSELGGPALVLDRHGEYSGLPGFRVVRVGLDPVSLDPLDPGGLEPGEAAKALCSAFGVVWPEEFGPLMAHLLREAYVRVLEGPGRPSLADLAGEVWSMAESGAGPLRSRRARDAAFSLASRLGELGTGLVARALGVDSGPGERLADLLAAGRPLVLDLSRLVSDGDRTLVSLLALAELEGLRRRRPAGVDRPHVAVVEEAHAVAPPGVSGGLVPRLLREARKFGVSVWLVDQRPSNVAQDAVGLCGTVVVGRLLHPDDLEALGLSRGDGPLGGVDPSLLGAGEWLVRVPGSGYSLMRSRAPR
ncbi:MAG: hypothetical protein DRO01_07640, partial [Thermoproteota archaeon]